jgi:hypothetical protein
LHLPITSWPETDQPFLASRYSFISSLFLSRRKATISCLQVLSLSSKVDRWTFTLKAGLKSSLEKLIGIGFRLLAVQPFLLKYCVKYCLVINRM